MDVKEVHAGFSHESLKSAHAVEVKAAGSAEHVKSDVRVQLLCQRGIGSSHTNPDAISAFVCRIGDFDRHSLRTAWG